MKILVCMLLLAVPAFATTKLNPGGQPQKKICEIRAKFSEVKAEQVSGGIGREARTTKLVFWHLDILGVSDIALCPTEKNLDLRIRSADFSGPLSEPNVVYAGGMVEPNRDDVIRAKIQFSKGRDTYTNRIFSEWILVDISND